MKFLHKYKLDVKEPSGLSFYTTNDTFLTVSDKTGKIYQISKRGKLLRELNFEGKDIEGITVNQKSKKIYCVEEKKKKIYELDENGNSIICILKLIKQS